MRKQDLLSADDLHEIFYIDESGVLRWRPRMGDTKNDRHFNSNFADKPAGTKNNSGHLVVKFNVEDVRPGYLAHHIVWAMCTGKWPAEDEQIDHRNNVEDDNRFENLRLCKQVQNAKNRWLNKDSRSGFKGVKTRKRNDAFEVYINVNKKRLFVGYFKDPKEAARAYDAAAIRHHGEFARTNASMGLL